MGIRNCDELRKLGFRGCHKIGDLMRDLESDGLRDIPQQPGVYVVCRRARGNPKFLRKSPAGHFKGEDPSVTERVLRTKWVRESQILYIGKSGGRSNAATLQKRIEVFMRFGQGKRVGHWGGRLVWQVKGFESFVVCWKPTPRKDPLKLEKEMLIDFKNNFRKLPFANWRLG